MKILINTISTKKITGGAFQIAQNFLLKSLEHAEIEWFYVTSQDVDDTIGYRFRHLMCSQYFVFPTQPDFRGSYKRVKKELSVLEARLAPDVVYSITSPSYFTFKAKEVMRFTNPWLTHPNKYSWRALSLKLRIKYHLYGWNQKRLMRNAHYFITQTETCAEGIRKITGEPYNHIKVVNNVLPENFKLAENTPVKEDDLIHIATVGAAIPHKNFDIIPDVLLELKKRGIDNVRFHITIAPSSVVSQALDAKLRSYNMSDFVINHGHMSQKDLGEMYRKCQFCFLPTLLEVFSASTLEAMYFQLPVVASHFYFNTEVMGDSCLYFKPTDAKDAARQITKLISNKSLQEECKQKMLIRLQKYGNYDAHFNEIKEFLVMVGTGKV